MPKEYSKKLKDIVDYLDKKYKKIFITNKIVKENILLIKKETLFLPNNISFPVRIYCIKNDILEIPKCLHCGKDVHFQISEWRFTTYCSTLCSANSSKTQDLKKQTTLKNYGVEYLWQSSKYRKSWEQTMLDKHGVKHALLSPMCRKKSTQTCLKNHGVKYPSQSMICRNKSIQTMKENGTKIGFSKSSQKLFWNIYNQLPKELQEKTYFGEEKGEINKYDNNKYYLYDFIISNIKICIEYNGEAFHPNKERLTEEEWNNWSTPYKNNKMNADKKYAYDQKKLDILRNKGFGVLEIWHSEYIKNPDIELNQCLDFINKHLSI